MAKCTHYWDIDERNVGVCRYCHRKRQFLGYDEVNSWRLGGERRKKGKRPLGEIDVDGLPPYKDSGQLPRL